MKTFNQNSVTLREVTSENAGLICGLCVKAEQQAYVVPTAVAIAEAAYSSDEMLQAIYADEAPVGLLVLIVQPAKSRHFLWRLMIDARYQGLGYGQRAMNLLIERAKADPYCSEFATSVVAGKHSPQGFYERLGFHLTGEKYAGESMMKFSL